MSTSQERIETALRTEWNEGGSPDRELFDLYHHSRLDDGETRVIGEVPPQLRNLFLLRYAFRNEFNDESHRQCVEIFGKEEYDNERIEFAVYTRLKDDPAFQGEKEAVDRFNDELRKYFPEIYRKGYLFFIDTDWNIRVLTEEARANIRKEHKQNERNLQRFLEEIKSRK